MATIENRSKYQVTVKNRPDLTVKFPFNRLADVKAHMAAVRAQGLKPRVEQEEDQFLVRIRQKGYPSLQVTVESRTAAENLVKKVEEERSRGLFLDYTKSLKVSFAELMVRFLRDEAPRHKSFQMQAYKLEGWLQDSGTAGEQLLQDYRDSLLDAGKPVRKAKFQMRDTCSELHWIHKPFPEVLATDIEDFMEERLQSVAPATLDRELDILRSIFTVATKVWDYNLAKNPMDAVRRPKYFNERERRISADEERRLADALAQLDFERAVEERLQGLVEDSLSAHAFSSDSARKKVMAAERVRLRPLAEDSCTVVPLLETFLQFQLMTAARRSETLSLTWDRIDFEGQTAYLPETKNGRPRRLALRSDLTALLRELPTDGPKVFPIGVDALGNAWRRACVAAGLEDLHIHDCRHEGVSRVAETGGELSGGSFSLLDLQLFSGHRDTRMLLRYAHLCSTRLAKKLDASFKTEGQYRLHRGRKVLTKAAGVRLAEVLQEPLGEAAERAPVLPVQAHRMSALSESPIGGNVVPLRPRVGRG